MNQYTTFTIATLFDQKHPLIVANNNNAIVTRKHQQGKVFYEKAYKNYNSSGIREVILATSSAHLDYVWKIIPNINPHKKSLNTQDAGLTITDWVNIRPINFNGNNFKPELIGVLHETTQFIYLLYHCLLAIRSVHQAGIIHLDIKADNICIPYLPNNNKYELDFSELKIIDFDMAFSRDLPLTESIKIQVDDEKNSYQAPRLKESIRNKSIEQQNQLDFGVDLYALGIMLHNILEFYDESLMPCAINPQLIDNQRIYKDINNIIGKLLTFETKKETTLDTCDVLIEKTEQLMQAIGIFNKANIFTFNVNSSQIYDWDKRVLTYNKPIIDKVSEADLLKNLHTIPTNKSFVVEPTNPEAFEQEVPYQNTEELASHEDESITSEENTESEGIIEAKHVNTDAINSGLINKDNPWNLQLSHHDSSTPSKKPLLLVISLLVVASTVSALVFFKGSLFSTKSETPVIDKPIVNKPIVNKPIVTKPVVDDFVIEVIDDSLINGSLKENPDGKSEPNNEDKVDNKEEDTAKNQTTLEDEKTIAKRKAQEAYQRQEQYKAQQAEARRQAKIRAQQREIARRKAQQAEAKRKEEARKKAKQTAQAEQEARNKATVFNPKEDAKPKATVFKPKEDTKKEPNSNAPNEDYEKTFYSSGS